MKMSNIDETEERHPLKVLFIEDNPNDLKLCLSTLKKNGYDVEFDVAELEKDVMELIGTKQYDIIISDYGLPSWTGLEAYRKLREMGHEVPLILVTGTLGDESAIECIKEGIADYVLKDNLGRLPSAVSRTLRTKALEDERKKTAKKLHLLSAMVEQSTDGMVHTDPEFRITYMNSAAEQLFGWSLNETHGKTPFLFYAEPNPNGLLADINAAVSSGAIYFGEFLSRRKDTSTFYSQIKVSSLFNQNNQIVGYVGCVRDVTDRKQAEEKIRQLNEGLEHLVAERTAELERTVAELETFSYAVSHDLRAPLRHITNSSMLLLESQSTTLDETGREEVASILATCARTGNIIEGLLTLSRVSRSEMFIEPVDLRLIAKEVVTEIQAEEPNRTINIVLPDSPIIVNGDERLLRVAMENLLQNAWKFTSLNAKARIEFGSRIIDGKTVCFVSDDGIGLDMKYADRIFDSFHRLHSTAEFEGAGIGLATTKRVIERHGGRIWVQGDVGKGSTFYFMLQPGQVEH